ncbi:chalcone isomerase family protein [Pseudomonas wadenswilerensis]
MAGTRRWLTLGLLLLLSLSARADWRADLPGARAVGQGEFTWFGLRVYSAQTWSAAAPLDWSQPFVLELTYHRNLSRDTLVEASLDEMRRLGGAGLTEATLVRWEAGMREGFVDVRPGMRIAGLYLPGQGCRFYIDGQLRRQVDDDAFARAFFSIWLDPRSRDPQLRQRLVGR